MGNKYSLHIGVEKYSPKKYPSGVNRLNFCINDMEAMARIALKSGFDKQDVCILPDEKATAAAVYDKIKTIKEALEQSGGLFLFTFAGHGIQRPDLSSSRDEGDFMDECICLYDGPLYDDDIFDLLSTFSKNCTIICFFDSCHSGTVHSFDPPPGQIRGLTDQELYQMRLLNSGQTIGNSTVRTPVRRIDAKGASFAACKDSAAAYEYEGHGYFTKAILDVIEKQKFKGTYSQFLDRIKEQLAGRQSPQLNPLLSFHPEPAFYLDRELFPLSIIR